MKALTLSADWVPKPGYDLTASERELRRPRNANMVWRSPRLSLGDAPDPSLLPDQVMLEVAAVGICGSDMHMYEAGADGYMIYPGLVCTPNILGHEFAGRIIEVGKAVRGLRVGDLVAVEEIQWCGQCTACRRGFVNHCLDIEEIGFTIPGAMAQYLPVRAKYCWKLDEIAAAYGEEEALIMGAMVEPTGVSYQGLFNRLHNWLPGNNVVIFGAGPIGLAAQALVIAAGAGRVIVFDPSTSRREIAMKMGASAALDPRDIDLDAAIMQYTLGRGVDYVVECAGFADKTIEPLDRCLAVNASIIDIGMGGDNPTLPIVAYKRMGVQYAGSLGHAGGPFQQVIRMMASGRIDMRQMVSARMPLDDAVAAFKRLESRQDAKIILQPN
ncbi:MAG: scyllo-inosose 3-dehydrogenase [Chloroflexi bacterium]|nr:scyllo-inosose 3-dehydrogenase [Chloroflexota bacterium]MCY3583305.1 scyllo-inosose 3-dehydrogenase [Chloroflexota bacterium]MCY3716354.1 scyllo-inosose 3-dehydrogenase [Chloroflexota bacterium]MDE2649446.1 scyllo-inosose 3-dehydrogenase [Chloroflexota bacterium]MXX51572.1 alcohol dehydrogenase catalytic domain-containing protein [Chloroflexota bacterium]